MKKSIEDYAKSLVEHGLYPTIYKARIESIRWHEKKERGLTEPLLCPHRPDMEIVETRNERGEITHYEHKSPKNWFKG